jgi:hypothetical protein
MARTNEEVEEGLLEQGMQLPCVVVWVLLLTYGYCYNVELIMENVSADPIPLWQNKWERHWGK